MLECMEIISIATEKGINIYTIKGNLQLDNIIQSKVMAMVFSMVSEIERDLISKRTKEALQTKRANGVQLGRPKEPGKSKLDVHKLEIEALLLSVPKLSEITLRISITGLKKIKYKVPQNSFTNLSIKT